MEYIVTKEMLARWVWPHCRIDEYAGTEGIEVYIPGPSPLVLANFNPEFNLNHCHEIEKIILERGLYNKFIEGLSHIGILKSNSGPWGPHSITLAPEYRLQAIIYTMVESDKYPNKNQASQ